jgi:phosphoadenosine phosphosulfate reductase
MSERGRTFAPGNNEIFWCKNCNVPLLSEKCSDCGKPGEKIILSPPADIRLCSTSGRELLKGLFESSFGCSDFLNDRIILLNKIAGLDRRDQAILDGHHIATLWFDIPTGSYKLDLELSGAIILAEKARKNIIRCSGSLLKGHIKGKWIASDQIEGDSPELAEGENVILRIGKFSGVGVVRKRGDGSKSIRVKEVTQRAISLIDRKVEISDVLKANHAHIKSLESSATKELNDYLSRNRLPVNVSFSGGKDSLASLCLCLKIKPNVDVLFINTSLEFPETVDYVRNLCKGKKLRLHEIGDKNGFFEQVESFGPPSKDFRWCCKTNKLGPLNSFIHDHYPKGCVTVEGRRIYESFSRSKIGAVERNPYVPNQTTLCPIREWNALEVVLYTLWNGLSLNPLYDRDYERIGCWLCPASLQSEFSNLKRSHPELYEQWNSFLHKWARENGLDPRYVDMGFWRWRSHPPKIVEVAEAEGIDLRARSAPKREIRLDLLEGRSPCGASYSIDANLSVPQNYPFQAVAEALCILGEVKYSESLGAAMLKADGSRCTVFASGHILVIAPKEKAEELLRRIVETILRVQTCTHCGICEKSCRQGAIKVGETISIDVSRCNHCGRCSKGCIAVTQASKLFDDLRAPKIGISCKTPMQKCKTPLQK